MGNRLALILSAFLMLMSMSGCGGPDSTQEFIFYRDSGIYQYSLDMTDSLSTYEILFYTRMETVDSTSVFPIYLVLESPSGEKYQDTHIFDYNVGKVSRYASDLDPYEHGIWTLTLNVRSDDVTGMGAMLKKKRNGTR